MHAQETAAGGVQLAFADGQAPPLIGIEVIDRHDDGGLLIVDLVEGAEIRPPHLGVGYQLIGVGLFTGGHYFTELLVGDAWYRWDAYSSPPDGGTTGHRGEAWRVPPPYGRYISGSQGPMPVLCVYARM